MLYVIVTIFLAYVVLFSYTMGMQQTTLLLGRQLAGIDAGTGLQDAITPRAQTSRNLLTFVLIVALFATTAYEYAWYHGVWVVIAACLGGVVVKAAFGLTEGHPIFVRAIRKDLEARRKRYVASGDSARVAAATTVLDRLKALGV